jgi:hypothetical protein
MGDGIGDGLVMRLAKACRSGVQLSGMIPPCFTAPLAYSQNAVNLQSMTHSHRTEHAFQALPISCPFLPQIKGNQEFPFIGEIFHDLQFIGILGRSGAHHSHIECI